MHPLRSNWPGARREGGSVSAGILDRLSNEAPGQFQFHLRFTICDWRGGVCQVPQREFSREHSQQTILFTFHHTATCRRQIIVTDQVQDSMDEVTDHLGLPRGAKLSRLLHRVVDANEDLSMNSLRKVSGPALDRR